MAAKQRFQLVIEPRQLEALRMIQERTGAPVSTQIRRAIDDYLETQTAISKSELKKLLAGPSK